MWPCVWPSARRRYPRLGAGLVRADATKEQIEELASDMMMEEVFSNVGGKWRVAYRVAFRLARRRLCARRRA